MILDPLRTLLVPVTRLKIRDLEVLYIQNYTFGYEF